jgi:hypothetical protein
LALVQIDFFSVLNDEQVPIDISNDLMAAASRPLEERVLEIGASYDDVLLDDAEQVHGLTLAHLARVRNDRRPGKYNHHSGAFGDLSLEENEDVAEDIYIGLDPSLQTLAIQRNGQFRSASVERLLTDLLNYPIILEPKLKPDVLERLDRVERIGSLHVKMSVGAQAPEFTGTLESVGHVIRQANENGTVASFDLSLTMQRGQNAPQNVHFFKRFLRDVFRSGSAKAVEARCLLGGEEHTEVINFLRDRVVHSGEVHSQGKRLDGDECKQLLRQAIQQQRSVLQGLMDRGPDRL